MYRYVYIYYTFWMALRGEFPPLKCAPLAQSPGVGWWNRHYTEQKGVGFKQGIEIEAAIYIHPLLVHMIFLL